MTTPRHSCPPAARKYVLIAAVLASSLGFIDGTVVAIALPMIRSDLHASFSQIQWVANGYLLLLSAFMLVGGAAGDRFGQRNIFGLGIVIFILASMLCAVAANANMLIASRIVQGLGAAIMIPGSLALIARNFPRDQRGKAIGIWAAATAITNALGPVLGGALLTYGVSGGWRLIFAINLPLGLIALGVLFARVPKDRPHHQKPLDWIGATLFTLALGLVAYGLTLMAGEETTTAMQFLVGGIALIALSLVWEKRALAPMLPLELFKSRAFSGANALTFILYTALGGLLFYLPLLLITGWGLNEMYAAGIMLPVSISIGLISGPAGRWADRSGTRMPLTIGPLVTAAGFVALALSVAAHNYWWGMLPAMALMSLGMALVISPLSTAVMLAASDGQSGIASGINNVVARVSMLFAIAGFGAMAGLTNRGIIAASTLPDFLKSLMIKSEYGERLTGGLYQLDTIDLQAKAMDQVTISILLISAALALAGSLLGWKTQPARSRTHS